MRGQAFIVFDDVESAKKAVSSMQGFPFHSKKMRIQYAKGDSDIISKRNGTYVPREQSKKKKKKTKKDKKSMAANPMAAMMNMMNPQMMMQMQKMMQSQGMQMPAGMNFQQMQKNMKEMMAKMQGGPKPAAPNAAPSVPTLAPKNMGLAEGKFGVNNILFVQDLPEEANAEMLSMLFNQFDGYIEVRMAPARPGAGKAAFIEFDDEATAGHAKDTLQGFKVTPSCQLKITFAKK